MTADKDSGIWRFLSRRQRIGIYVLTVAMYPWILYEKLRGKQ